METVENKAKLGKVPADLAKFKNLVANIPGVIYRCEIQHPWQMFFISDEILNITGYSPSDFLGKNPKKIFGDLIHPDDVDKVSSVTQKAIESGQQYVYQYRMIDKSGKVHFVFEKGRASYDSSGAAIYLDGAIFDVTDKAIAVSALKKAKREADTANKAKSLFLANMSHEIRTPMNSILGFADLLAKSPLGPRELKFVNHIRKSGKTLLSLINDILDLSKIEAGKFTLKYDYIDIRMLVDEVLQMFALHADQKQVNLSLEIDRDLPSYLYIDDIRFRQVLINLVGNAVKFTQKGRITIRLIWKNLTNLTVEVEDTGIGIDESQQEQIFDKFAQLESATKCNSPGTGLGLAISKQLIELMGGLLSVKSKLGKGSTFTIFLPEIKSKDSINLSTFTESASVIEFEPARILVADDVEENRALIEAYLADQNVELTLVSDGHALFEKSKERFDLILTDIKMPKLDGLTAIRKIKEEIANGNLDMDLPPCIAMTASVLPEEKSKVQQDFDGYVAKPIKQKVLYDALKKFLPHKNKGANQSDKAKAVETSSSTSVTISISRNDIDTFMKELYASPGKATILREIKNRLVGYNNEKEVRLIDGKKNIAELTLKLFTSVSQFDSMGTLNALRGIHDLEND